MTKPRPIPARQRDAHVARLTRAMEAVRLAYDDLREHGYAESYDARAADQAEAGLLTLIRSVGGAA